MLNIASLEQSIPLTIVKPLSQDSDDISSLKLLLMLWGAGIHTNLLKLTCLPSAFGIMTLFYVISAGILIKATGASSSSISYEVFITNARATLKLYSTYFCVMFYKDSKTNYDWNKVTKFTSKVFHLLLPCLMFKHITKSS